MKFPNYYNASTILENNCHGGKNAILFSRVLESKYFATPIDFIDYTIIPPLSTIGLHKHADNEEIYIILKGTGKIIINDEISRIISGDIIKNNKFGAHGLINVSNETIEIIVIQVSSKMRSDRNEG